MRSDRKAYRAATSGVVPAVPSHKLLQGQYAKAQPRDLAPTSPKEGAQTKWLQNSLLD